MREISKTILTVGLAFGRAVCRELPVMLGEIARALNPWRKDVVVDLGTRVWCEMCRDYHLIENGATYHNA